MWTRYLVSKFRYYGKSGMGLDAGALVDYILCTALGVTPHVD